MSGVTPARTSLRPAAYFTKGLPSIQQKWWWRWKKWVKVVPQGSSRYLEFHVFDGEGKEVPV